MEKPRLKPHVAVVPVSPGNLLLRGPALFVRYSGDAVEPLLRLLPLVDGTRALPALARDAGLSEQDARDLLEALAADRVLEDAAHDEGLRLPPAERERLDPQLQLWSHLTSNPSRAQNRLADAKVAVLGDGEAARATRAALEASGARVVDAFEGADHAVLALDEPRVVDLLAWNERALAAKVPLTFVVLDGLGASVGPTVIPGQTACWRCYDLRVKGTHPNLERLLAYEASLQKPPRRVGMPAFAQVAGAFAAEAVALTLTRAVVAPLAGWVLRISFLDLHAEKHRVLRIPRCPACSRGDVPDVDRYALEPVTLS